MGAVAKPRLSQIREFEVRLVYDRRCVEGDITPLTASPLMSHLAKPIVNDRHELLERSRVPVAPALQEQLQLRR
jgi:hypothetical protein